MHIAAGHVEGGGHRCFRALATLRGEELLPDLERARDHGVAKVCGQKDGGLADSEGDGAAGLGHETRLQVLVGSLAPRSVEGTPQALDHGHVMLPSAVAGRALVSIMRPVPLSAPQKGSPPLERPPARPLERRPGPHPHRSPAARLSIESARLRPPHHQLRRREHLGQGRGGRSADPGEGSRALRQGLRGRPRFGAHGRLFIALHRQAGSAETRLPRERA